jgi:hypothetical protein
VPDTGLKFHYIVHSSLDVIEERGEYKQSPSPLAHVLTHTSSPFLAVGKKLLVTSDKYLGLLYPTEEFKVYGCVTMTRVKFILALDDNANPKDADLKLFFTKFHALYVDAISNPFYTLDDKIDSKKFEKEVSQLVAAGL